MTRRFRLFALGLFGGVLAWSAAGAAQSQRKLDITFKDGRVSVSAENVTLREIMQEWGRKGGSRIVNADKLGGSPIPSIEFKDEPEAAVLRSLLRDVPGYGAAPRIANTPSESTFGAVFILASRSVPTSGTSSSVAPPIQSAPPPQPQSVPRPIEGSADSEIPPVRQVQQGELPPSTPGSPSNSNNTNLRQGPGGAVTSTIPGVVIPGPATPAGGRGGPATPSGRGGRGGGGQR